MDLVCGRQHKIGIVFKWTTARLTLNGIKLHSKPKSKKDLRATALCLGVWEMHTCTCVHPHRTWFSSPRARIYPFPRTLPEPPCECALPEEPLPSAGSVEPFQPTLICCHSPGSCSAYRQQGQFSDGINPAQRLSRGSQSLILSDSQCPQQHWAHRTVSHDRVPSLKGICLDVST